MLEGLSNISIKGHIQSEDVSEHILGNISRVMCSVSCVKLYTNIRSSILYSVLILPFKSSVLLEDAVIPSTGSCMPE